jgi:hypothetical protein
MRDVRRAEAMSARLKVPLECRVRGARGAMASNRWSGARSATGGPARRHQRADALRRPERLEALLHACECVAMSAPDALDDFAPARYLLSALWGRESVPRRDRPHCRGARHPQSARSDAIAKAIRSARLAALRA